MTHDTPHRHRLTSLRAALKAQGLDGFILPRADAWPGEFVRACAERVAWLSGFTGSGGTLVVLADRAAALTHSLYAIQIRRQVDGALFEAGDIVKTPVAGWIARNASPGFVVGYDPWLHTAPQIRAMTRALAGRGVTLRPVEPNPIDALWVDRPAAPESTVEVFPDALAGRTSAEKREDIARSIGEKGAQAALIAAADSVAWLLNVRGRDVPETPVALSTVLLHATGSAQWFIAPARVPGSVRDALGPDVAILPPEALGAALDALAGQTVLVDESRTPVWMDSRLCAAGAVTRAEKDPCIQPRACKTSAEIAAVVEAHRRDGLAMVRLLAWIDREIGRGVLDEVSIGDKSVRLRAEVDGFRGVSFFPIVAFNANAALPHYRATAESNIPVRGAGILLIDSGGQYLDSGFAGTTDITRTIAIGPPSLEMKIRNTQVLKGHIAVATAVFPEGSTGAQMDALARAALWADGVDFLHRTGHGVGIYLGVHEDAAGIGPKETEPFQSGMVISNEPGYYKEGAYGIRIENLVVVVEDTGRTFEDGRRALGFRTITTVPIDTRLILPERLSAAERGWINAYHARILGLYRDDLDADDRTWLEGACAPV
jgi:Xaa-Pro aminopeptidase